MAGRPTIIDVAKKAGVSKSTVSLVLQNSKTVKEETRQKVREAMEATGYVYNRGAANMRGSGTGMIGLVINNLRNPYYTEFAVSTQMSFSEKGYATVIANSNEDAALQEQLICSMLEHGVDALLVAPCYGGSGKDFDQIARAGLPAMQVLRQADDRVDHFPFYSMDYKIGSKMAAEHLIEAGAQNIAFVGGIEGQAITLERRSGYLDILAEHGRSPQLFHGAASRAFGFEQALEIARSDGKIDAAMAFNDLVALGMVAGFAKAGIELGSDFKLVGFDDIEEAAQSYPGLSSVRCDVGGFGQKSAEMMLAWLENGKHPGTPGRVPVELVPRASSQAD